MLIPLVGFIFAAAVLVSAQTGHKSSRDTMTAQARSLRALCITLFCVLGALCAEIVVVVGQGLH